MRTLTIALRRAGRTGRMLLFRWNKRPTGGGRYVMGGTRNLGEWPGGAATHSLVAA